MTLSQSNIQTTMSQLQRDADNKLAAMEDQPRRNNLVIFGLPEQADETWDKTEHTVRQFLSEDLKMENAENQREVEIERAQRLGTKRHGQVRPVLVRYLRWKTKNEVYVKARDLPRDSQLSIGEDLSKLVRDKRKLL